MCSDWSLCEVVWLAHWLAGWFGRWPMLITNDISDVLQNKVALTELESVVHMALAALKQSKLSYQVWFGDCFCFIAGEEMVCSA